MNFEFSENLTKSFKICQWWVCLVWLSFLLLILNINSSHSPTKFLQSANLTSYTILSPFSLQVEPAPHSCHTSSTICIFLITNQQPLFHICINLPVESGPFFIPSTTFCSLSSWFTSSCTYHLITVTTFALTIYRSLGSLLQTINSSLSQTLSSIVFWFLMDCLPSWILNLYWTKWALAFVCFSFFFYIFFWLCC